MSFRTSAFVLVGSVLILTGCVDRATADARLAKGCEAGINAVLTDGLKVGKVVSVNFSDSPDGVGLRQVNMKAVETDGWAETEKEYVCIFEENMGFMNSKHVAALYQLRLDESRVYGKAGEKVTGSVQDFVKLNEAISAAMGD